MASLEDQPLQRLATGLAEFDRVLGGGLVPGSLVLVGGDPGIGKSTLLLQSASAMAAGASVLYVSAEESAQQVKLRWQRLAGGASELQLLAETDLERCWRSWRPCALLWRSSTAFRRCMTPTSPVRRGPSVRCVNCLLYTSPSPRDLARSRMPSSA